MGQTVGSKIGTLGLFMVYRPKTPQREREQVYHLETPEGRGRVDAHGKRVEMPNFSGEDPYRWLFRVEQYYNVFEVPERQSIDGLDVYGRVSFELV